VKSLRQIILLLCIISTQAIAQSKNTYQFDIEAQPVSSALIDFAVQMQLNVVFLNEIAQEKQSNMLKGEYTVDDAMDILVDGTGLRAVVLNDRVIQIQAILVPDETKQLSESDESSLDVPAEKTKPEKETGLDPYRVIDEVVVVGQLLSPYNLGAEISSTKTQRSFLETPQIVNTVNETLIRDNAARDYTDAILLLSSVSYLERSAGVVDETRLRGFAYPALKTDGFGSHAYITPIDLALVDRIEMAKGPNSVLFGRMEPGGIVNVLLKKPDIVKSSMSFRSGSDGLRRAEFDVNHVGDNQGAFRLLGYYQNEGSAEELDLDDRVGGLLTYQRQLSNQAELNAYYRFSSQDALQQFGRPLEGFSNEVELVVSDDGSVDVLSPLLEDLRSGLDVDQHSVYVGIRDWLIQDWSANLHFQYDTYSVETSLRYPFIEEFTFDFNGETINSDDLTDSLIDDPELLEALTDDIESLSVDPDNVLFFEAPLNYDTRFFSAEATIAKKAKKRWGEYEQLYGVNASYSQPESLIWQTHDTRSSFVPTGQVEEVFNADVADNDVTDTNFGIFSQWALTYDATTGVAGVRLDYIDFDATSAFAASNQTFTEVSLRLGLVHEFAENSSLFLNYSVAFSPQFALRDFDVEIDSEIDQQSIIRFLEPAKSKQYELGVKFEWLNRRLQTNCSLYRIEKTGIESDIERQRSQGLECDTLGSLGEGWHIIAGGDLLNSTIVDGPEEDFIGKVPRMTPEKNFRIWLSKDWVINADWFARSGVGANFVGERYINSENSERLDSYLLVNVGISLDFRESLSIAMTVKNVFDEAYTEGVFTSLPFWTTLGQQRTIELLITYRF